MNLDGFAINEWREGVLDPGLSGGTNIHVALVSKGTDNRLHYMCCFSQTTLLNDVCIFICKS